MKTQSREEVGEQGRRPPSRGRHIWAKVGTVWSVHPAGSAVLLCTGFPRPCRETQHRGPGQTPGSPEDGHHGAGDSPPRSHGPHHPHCLHKPAHSLLWVSAPSPGSTAPTFTAVASGHLSFMTHIYFIYTYLSSPGSLIGDISFFSLLL